MRWKILGRYRRMVTALAAMAVSIAVITPVVANTRNVPPVIRCGDSGS